MRRSLIIGAIAGAIAYPLVFLVYAVMGDMMCPYLFPEQQQAFCPAFMSIGQIAFFLANIKTLPPAIAFFLMPFVGAMGGVCIGYLFSGRKA